MYAVPTGITARSAGGCIDFPQKGSAATVQISWEVAWQTFLHIKYLQDQSNVLGVVEEGVAYAAGQDEAQQRVHLDQPTL